MIFFPYLEKVFSRSREVFAFCNKAGFSKRMLLVPSFFGLLASVFEGISTCLIVPTLQGMIRGNYDFVLRVPAVQRVFSFFPDEWVSKSFFVFLFLVTLVFLGSILKYVFLYLSNISMASLSSEFVNVLRKMIHGRFLRFGKAYFDRNRTGRIFNVLITFPSSLRTEFFLLNKDFSMFFHLLVYLAIMAWISFELFLFSLVLFPVSMACANGILTRIREASWRYRDVFNVASQNMYDSIGCLSLVKANARQDFEQGRFSASSNALKTVELSMARKQGMISPLQEIVLLCMMILLVSFMAALAVHNKDANIGGYIVFIYLLRRSSAAVSAVNDIRTVLARMSGSIREIKDVFADKDKHIVHEGSELFPGLQERISIRGLSFQYEPPRTILDDITLSISKGKMTAIVGASGSGKTTLIHVLLRFYDCPPGTIFLDGRDIRSYRIDSLMRHMAFVGQEAPLFHMSLRYNIEYGAGRELTDDEMRHCLRLACLEEFVDSLPAKLDTLIGDRGICLSGGERQRVSLAAALAKGAEILVLDEATSALDTRTERLIQQAIDATIKGRTAIVVAHRLSTIRNADQIIVLDQGKVVEEGAFSELLSRQGVFHRLWEEQRFF